MNFMYINIATQFVRHRKHYVSATKPSRLMMFRETVAVYCENHTEHTDTLCGQNAGLLQMLKQAVDIVTTVLSMDNCHHIMCGTAVQ
jgi:hypothetical protein